MACRDRICFVAGPSGPAWALSVLVVKLDLHGESSIVLERRVSDPCVEIPRSARNPSSCTDSWKRTQCCVFAKGIHNSSRRDCHTDCALCSHRWMRTSQLDGQFILSGKKYRAGSFVLVSEMQIFIFSARKRWRWWGSAVQRKGQWVKQWSGKLMCDCGRQNTKMRLPLPCTTALQERTLWTTKQHHQVTQRERLLWHSWKERPGASWQLHRYKTRRSRVDPTRLRQRRIRTSNRTEQEIPGTRIITKGNTTLSVVNLSNSTNDHGETKSSWWPSRTGRPSPRQAGSDNSHTVSGYEASEFETEESLDDQELRYVMDDGQNDAIIGLREARTKLPQAQRSMSFCTKGDWPWTCETEPINVDPGTEESNEMSGSGRSSQSRPLETSSRGNARLVVTTWDHVSVNLATLGKVIRGHICRWMWRHI